MKTAIYGVWHVHAGGYTEKAKELSEVVGVYDENPERCKEFAEKYGIKEFKTSKELLESDADGVIVCSSSDSHAKVITDIANAKKDIFTEKVLALTDEDCDEIEKAVRENGVNFVISLPQKYDSQMITAKNIADSGELGKINFVRFRNCHSGSVNNWLPPHFYDEKECGGGAMIDLGAHGMYLIDWILGKPQSAKSLFTVSCERDDVKIKNKDGVEDNAVTVMGYANGAIAVNETGFVSNHYPRILEIGGEKGRVYVEGNDVYKVTDNTEGKKVKVGLCQGLPKPIEQFLTGKVLTGCGIKEAKALTHMMVMAYN